MTETLVSTSSILQAREYLPQRAQLGFQQCDVMVVARLRLKSVCRKPAYGTPIVRVAIEGIWPHTFKEIGAVKDGQDILDACDEHVQRRLPV